MKHVIKEWIIVIILSLLASTVLVAAGTEPPASFRFPGGPNALTEYIQDNLEYPEYARENNVQGKVHVSFMLNADGEVFNVQTGPDLCPSCQDAIQTLFLEMPRWEILDPDQFKEPLRISFTIEFRLLLS